ncbi:Uu.00g015400.m01.CDS01 [Anthostomella pinea]|uniref:Uu.00g015400.m01.CDS01 n=1 Tax=Anthostomella pinea TaxID=933095 RepID=A0AAI8VSR2_9PEZI|nr:Uu.00g015400.m01.CDS01 [Anthostomella pinea]
MGYPPTESDVVSIDSEGEEQETGAECGSDKWSVISVDSAVVVDNDREDIGDDIGNMSVVLDLP